MTRPSPRADAPHDVAIVDAEYLQLDDQPCHIAARHKALAVAFSLTIWAATIAFALKWGAGQ